MWALGESMKKIHDSEFGNDFFDVTLKAQQTEENIDTTLINLEELEQEYFEKYLPAFFGFNQKRFQRKSNANMKWRALAFPAINML